MPDDFINQSQLAGAAPKVFGAGGLLATVVGVACSDLLGRVWFVTVMCWLRSLLMSAQISAIICICRSALLIIINKLVIIQMNDLVMLHLANEWMVATHASHICECHNIDA